MSTASSPVNINITSTQGGSNFTIYYSPDSNNPSCLLTVVFAKSALIIEIYEAFLYPPTKCNCHIGILCSFVHNDTLLGGKLGVTEILPLFSPLRLIT